MNRLVSILFGMGLFLASATPVFAQSKEKLATLGERIEKLEWIKTPGVHRIEGAHATYTLTGDQLLLVGPDARKFGEILVGEGTSDGLVLVSYFTAGPLKKSIVFFYYQETGFVDDSDWATIEPDAVLAFLQKQQAIDNENRRKNGVRELHIEDWAEKPRYNPSTNTAFWAINVSSGENTKSVTSEAIKLGRYGISNVIWSGSPEVFAQSSPMETMLANFSFDPGSTYADFRDGDTLSALSLAAVAASLMKGKGVTTAAVGLLATLLIYVKKFWLLILVPLAAVWHYIRRNAGNGPQT